MVVDIFQPVVAGIILGALFALVGTGLTLVYGVLDIINAAHAAFLVVGALLAFNLSTEFGINIYLTIPIVIVVMGVVGYLLQRWVIQRLIGERQLFVMILTFGLAEVIRGGYLLVQGPNLIRAPPDLPIDPVTFLGVVLVPAEIMIVLSLLPLGAIMYVFLYKTWTGKAMRAVRDDEEAAEVLGVDIKHIYALTMAFAAATAGTAGVFLLTVRPVNQTTVYSWLIFAFTVVVFGGLGSVTGSIVGGLILGVVVSVLQFHISQGIGLALTFMLMIGVLVVHPTGLMGLEHEIEH